MDDLGTVVLVLVIAFGVLVLLACAVVAYVMWRYQVPPRGVVAMCGALLYLALPVDVVPEVIFGPLGLVDDAGVATVAAIWVYKLVKARQKLVDAGVQLPSRRPPRQSRP